MSKTRIQIKNIFGKVLYELECETIKEAVVAAIKKKVDLRYADLRGASLSGASLRGASLRYASLRYADLSGVDLRSVDLSGVDLSGANLSDANLRYASLSDANLSGVDLSGADLSGASLSGVDLSGVDLSGVDLSGVDLSGVPKIKNIHQEVYKAATQMKNSLDMSNWHTCETTHCRAGWVVHLAGNAGKAMEWCLGTASAAAMIYLASDADLEKIPNFYCDNETALEDMKRLAEREAAQQV